MKKINFKHFRHLMSAMLFTLDTIERDACLMELFVKYKAQSEPDPVVWAREELKDYRPGTHEMYIRRSFTALTYHQAQAINQVG